jgi:hypothetical protein
MFGRECFDMVPPNILSRLATCSDVPKSRISELPPARPLDSHLNDPYFGEIRFNTEDLKCYEYTELGWKEIK